MPQAKPEFVLNHVMNRFQLNFKRNVGSTSDSIRECRPSTLEEWKDYYYDNVRSSDHIDSLGERLYEKISEVVSEENRFHPNLLDQIDEEMCIEYMHNLVINRTWNGYAREEGLI
ncbi:MAG: MjaI family restriction endonuclease [Candidatus Poseidoniaceae archaeon]|jgi:hypothetical protein|nr:MjaI family restriction endonuclease [Candidatus Poseidoniaceae archaeon]